MPDLNDPRPVYLQIADDLRKQIRSGQMAPGTRMPSQRELAQRYGVAFATLRSALNELVKEGVASAGSTRGTFVLKKPGETEGSAEYRQLARLIGELAERIDDLEDRLRQVEQGHVPAQSEPSAAEGHPSAATGR